MSDEDRPRTVEEIIAQSEGLADRFESFEPGESTGRPSIRTNLHVRRMVYHLPVPVEMAMDHGLMTEEEARAQGWVPPPPVPPPSWRTRAHLRIWELRERLAVRLYRILTGQDVPGDDDD